MPQTPPEFAVVIPYYQREPGVLRRALGSVFSQVGIDRAAMHVYIVDDGSPISAKDELQKFDRKVSRSITVISQENGGPGAARNLGLSNVPSGARYIAFLDSDDEWSSDHLSNAAIALSSGFDCYFANFYQLAQTIGAFERAGRIRVADHPLIQGRTNLRAYAGDMFNQVITGNIIGTPTVVYDFERFRDVRFYTDLRSAGEDYLFWLNLASRGARFAFSDHIEVKCGSGVNVFSGSGWGTEGELRRIQDELKYRAIIKGLFTLSEVQKSNVNGAIKRLRVEFARAVIHRIVRLRPLPLGLIVTQICQDPAVLAGVVTALKRTVLDKGRQPR